MILTDLIDLEQKINIDDQFNNPYIDDDYFDLILDFKKSHRTILNIQISKTKYYNNLVYFQSLIWWMNKELDNKQLLEMPFETISGEADIDPDEDGFVVDYELTQDKESFYLKIIKK